MIENYENYKMNKKELICFFLIAGLLIMVLGFLFFDEIIFTSLFLVFLYPGKKVWVRYLAEKRKKELLLQFRDLLYSLSASVATGRQMADGLNEAISTVGRIYGDGSILKQELIYMVKKIFDAGENDEFVLKDFALRTGIKEIINFADIYSISKRTGADLQRVIRKTVEVLLDRIEAEREMRALTSQKRLEFAILTAMPPLTLMFLRITSPGYLDFMYKNPSGKLLMALALGALILAAYMSYIMTKTT